MPQSKRMRAKKKQRRSQRAASKREKYRPNPKAFPPGPYLKEDLDGNLIPVDYPRVDPT